MSTSKKGDNEGNSAEEISAKVRRGAKKEVEAVPPALNQEPSTLQAFEIAQNGDQDLEIARLGLEVEGLRQQQEQGGHIHLARLVGLGLLFFLVVGWLICILFFVGLSGFPGWHDFTILKLPQPVVLALIGSTTLNVLGLFGVAARWLYGAEKAASSKPAAPRKK